MRFFRRVTAATLRGKKMTHNIDPQGTLHALMAKVADQSARTQDFLTSTGNLQLETGNNTSKVVLERSGGVPTTQLRVNDVAFQQIASQTGIDVRTARRFQEHYPDVLDHAVNRIWGNESTDRMLRTFDNQTAGKNGTLRAFVSSKFKTFDNVHLLESTLPTLMESDAQWRVANADLTDKRLYMRFVSDVIQAEPVLGDVMANGVGLSNSEVGMGSVSVYQWICTLACLNGMRTEKQTRSSHVTSARSSDSYELLTDEAKTADNRALSLKTRDILASYASRQSFDEVIEQMRDAHGDRVNAAAVDAVAGVVKVLNGKKSDNTLIMDGLMKTVAQTGYVGRPLSRATIVNAVTAVGNMVEPDDKDEWHANGAKILNLSPSEWSVIKDAEPLAA
jgi:hypothetical protein